MISEGRNYDRNPNAQLREAAKLVLSPEVRP